LKYDKVQPGQWVRPIRRNYRMACCDCGLVHRMEFKLIPWARGKKILFRAYRDEAESRRLRKNRQHRYRRAR